MDRYSKMYDPHTQTDNQPERERESILPTHTFFSFTSISGNTVVGIIIAAADDKILRRKLFQLCMHTKRRWHQAT